ncbi:MAG: hypothetical protein Kow00128_01670 [Deltaproteobacteria bacterium]
MERVILSAMLAILIAFPLPARGEFDPSAYRPITQEELAKDPAVHAGGKYVVTDPFQFCGSDFCVQIHKTRINTRDYYCITLGSLCLVRMYVKKDHPDAAKVAALRKGDIVTVYGTFDYLGAGYRYILVDRLEVKHSR